MKLVYIDHQNSLHLDVDGLYERFETKVVQRFLKPGQVFVDVGAHIGYYSVLAAEIVGPMGIVHAFEPAPENIKLLKLNVAGFGNVVRIHPCAVSDHVGCTNLYLSEENSGDHRLYEMADRKSVNVDIVNLDSIDEFKNKSIDFIKIDVQGEECRVLRGGQELLRQSPDVIGLIELSPEHLRLAGSSPKELLSILAELGFLIYRCKKNQLVQMPPDTKVALRQGRHLNLFFARKRIK